MKYTKLFALALMTGFTFVTAASAAIPSYPVPSPYSTFCGDVAQNGMVDWSVYLEEGLGLPHMGSVDGADLDNVISVQSDDAQAVLMKFKAFVSKVDGAVLSECSKPGANSVQIYNLYMKSISSGKNMLVNRYNPNLLEDFKSQYIEMTFS